MISFTLFVIALVQNEMDGYFALDLLALETDRWNGSLFYITINWDEYGEFIHQIDVLYMRDLFLWLKDKWRYG